MSVGGGGCSVAAASTTVVGEESRAGSLAGHNFLEQPTEAAGGGPEGTLAP